VCLRALGERDLPALLAIFGDPEVTRYSLFTPFPDLVSIRTLLASIDEGFATRTLFQWGIMRRDDGQVVGTCTLAALDVQHRRADLGYFLARSAWGAGYVREALPLLLDYAFGTLALHRLVADIDPRNVRSGRVLESLGFRPEGYLREHYLMPDLDEVQDTALYGLLADEWRERAARTRAVLAE